MGLRTVVCKNKYPPPLFFEISIFFPCALKESIWRCIDIHSFLRYGVLNNIFSLIKVAVLLGGVQRLKISGMGKEKYVSHCMT